MLKLPKIDDSVAGDQQITRFVVESGKLSDSSPPNPKKCRIKDKAFWPETNPKTQIYETSVIISTELPEVDERVIGDETAQKRSKTLRGIVRGKVEVINSISLDVIYDGEGHELHSTIQKWPSSKEDMMEKVNDLVEALQNSPDTVAFKV